jgi:hypothetical protein
MTGIAVIGSAMFAVRWMFFVSTVYSTGYDESRFRQVRVGMTSEEVEQLLGPPLKKVPWWQPGVWGQPSDVNWLYTDCRPGFSNYWMRNVLMGDGKVIQVQSTYWVD